ncbi:MAG: ABC transporter ATP-binding protein [Oscillospiraceae bacterium]|jgi:ABC-2 type transport system ATP-binding protein|nr:ABC transporter ATP-binding protein [Oscillospiraceae bacterium]
MAEVAVRLENVSMRFNLNRERVDNLKEYFIKFLSHKLSYNEFWGLRDVSFTVEKGERLGILGLNGAGKSTLLKVVSGVMRPTFGTLETYGDIAPLLELGAGFDPAYSGGENIYLYGATLGYSRNQVKGIWQEIVDFAELQDFIDVPVKNYSSGMRARLGFAIACMVDPDILILDEVLAVGDKPFRVKCEAKIQSLFEKGVTVLFVSHNLEQVQRLCNKAILLEQGRIIAAGDVDSVAAVYQERSGARPRLAGKK